MSSSIMSSPLVIFVIPSILLILSTPSHSTSSSTLINQICAGDRWFLESSKLCTQVLESQPMVASATNMLNLSIASMKSGILLSTRTHTYIENLLTKHSTDPGDKGALKECSWSYDSAAASMSSALTGVLTDASEYMIATYDLMIAGTDDINFCERAVASNKIKDRIILNGNRVVPIFALAASDAIDAFVLVRDGK